jgi:hypothetical protein
MEAGALLMSSLVLLRLRVKERGVQHHNRFLLGFRYQDTTAHPQKC